jgi:hypothetical protein
VKTERLEIIMPVPDRSAEVEIKGRLAAERDLKTAKPKPTVNG